MVWDFNILERWLKEDHLELHGAIDFLVEAHNAEWRQDDSTIEDIANESYKIGHVHAYEPAQMRLPVSYYKQALPIVQRQLTMGGIRLANLLNKITGLVSMIDELVEQTKSCCQLLAANITRIDDRNS